MIVFFCGCISKQSNEKVLLKQKIQDGTSITAVYFETLSTSPSFIWVIRRLSNGNCYITGKVEASSKFKEIKIDKFTDSGFMLMVNYPVTDNYNEWVQFKINYKDTFCLNNNCKAYPVDCDY